MGHSTRAASLRKPHPNYPLTPRGDGRWCKKIKGQVYYFAGTSQEALDEWLRVKDDLLAGRIARPKTDSLTVGELCDRFLQAKDVQLAAGELRKITWLDYKTVCDRVVTNLGKTRAVSDLNSDDFAGLRESFAKTRGPVSVANDIQRTRVLFKFAYDAGLIEQPMRYGPLFRRPSKKVQRLQRAKQGPKLFAAADVLALLDAAKQPVKAMIMLAINCGFGNTDCGTLAISAIDLENGWVDFPRPKTAVPRRCALWPETIEAIKDILAKRRQPKNPMHRGLLFLTKRRDSFAKENSHDNPIQKEFAKLVKPLKLRQLGRGFYSLRHTFRTIAGAAKDLEATRAIMGHANSHVEDTYVERIEDDRLRAVSDYVRSWLFADAAKAKQPTKAKRKPQPAKRETVLRVVG